VASLHQWLSFTLIALFVTLTPGPAVILALSNSLALGPVRAMISSLGNALGLVIVASATITGLGALLMASATAFIALKIAGAGYLIYLGIKQWRAKSSALGIERGVPQSVPAVRLFLRGLSVALTNPKAILFFIAFLPQFIEPGAWHATQAAVLIATFAGCSVAAHIFYVLLAQRLKRYLSSTPRQQAMNRLFGASFIGLGLSLFTLKNRTA
jgi:homoserine/homoserine lactone efflux protein